MVTEFVKPVMISLKSQVAALGAVEKKLNAVKLLWATTLVGTVLRKLSSKVKAPLIVDNDNKSFPAKENVIGVALAFVVPIVKTNTAKRDMIPLSVFFLIFILVVPSSC